jgi:chemotaxis protein methyltransferase WspC
VPTGERSGIEQLLADRIGLDLVAVGSGAPLRAAQRRMRELGLNDLAAYEERLRASEDELGTLIDEITVGESWFFRDARPFELVREYVRSGWLNNPLRAPLRVLSLACAGGEEPYSIAIVLSELKLPAVRYSIDAIDLSARRLAIAQRGLYSANAFRGVESHYQEHYFRKHPEGFELSSAIRARVRFLQANVLDPRLLEASSPYDVILCRNLLIYLGTQARHRVVAVIDRLLAADGLLVLGHADRLDSSSTQAKFTPVGDPGAFAYRRAASIPSVLAHEAVEPVRPLGSANPSSGRGGGVDAGRDPPSSALACSTDCALAKSQEVSTARTSEPALLSQAADLANTGRFDRAIALCERHLQHRGPSAAAFSLLGMIYQSAGDRGRAEDCFHKAVYLDPADGEALLALALLAERRGDRDAAAGLRRRAQRTLTANEKRAN